MNVIMKTNKMRWFNTLIALCLAVGMLPMAAFAKDAGAASLGEGEMRLTKVAEPVEGEVNSWRVTVTAESKDAQKPKDYILVFDRSGSMLYDENNTKNKTEVENSRIVYAREAAKELVDGIYNADGRNRIAVLSYAAAPTSDIDTNTGFYKEGTEHTSLDIGLSGITDKNAVCTAIDGIKGERVTGGTYTQLALHQAQEVMANAHQESDGAERDRVIILLSDGAPTLATEVDWNQVSSDQFTRANIGSNDCQIYRQSRYTSGTNVGKLIYIDADTGKNTPNKISASGKPNAPKMIVTYADTANNVLTNGTVIPETAFDYENANTNTIGYGVNVPYGTSDNKYGNEAVYGNIQNLTIAEADNIRAKNDVEGIFVIGYNVSGNDEEAVKAIAGDSDHYVDAKGANGIKTAMKTILEKTSATKFSATVSDRIPLGFTDPEDIQVSCGNYKYENGVIDWNFDTPNNIKENQDPNEATERYATLSYILRIGDSDTFAADEFFKTNGETKVTYDNPFYPADPTKQKTAEVESPQVKVSKYTLKKKVMNDTADDTVFTIHVTSPSGTVKEINLKNNEEQTVTDFFETGNYTIEEIVDSKGYSVKYLIDGDETNTFSMETQQTSQSKLVSIEIQNTKKAYNTSYRFVSLDPSDTIPDEVMALLPTGQNGVLNKTEVTAEQPQEVEVTIGADTWVFKGYDANSKTIDGADIEFVGTWTRIHTPPYKAIYEYVSGTPGKDLPEEVKNLTPADVLNKDHGETLEAEQPAAAEVVVDGGKWVFKGYDKDSVTFDNTDEKFTGTWEFIENTYTADYKYVSGTPGKDLPEEVKNLTPAKVTDLRTGDTEAAEQPARLEVPADGGKWVFKGYDKDSVTISDQDERFTGTWEFVENIYSADYEYVSGTPGKDLPEEVKNLTPAKVTDLLSGDTETAEQPVRLEVPADGGKWVFKGYDKDSVTIVDQDERFVGVWEFVEDTDGGDGHSLAQDTTKPTKPSIGITSGSGQTKNPATGDNSNRLLWVVLLTVSCGGTAAAGVIRKKKNSSI